MKYFMIIIPLFFLYSCDLNHHLDSTPPGSITEGNFYQTESQLEGAVNDIYRQMGILYDADGIPSLYGELYSDNGEVMAGVQLPGNAWPMPINAHQINPNNGDIESAWDDSYEALFVINNAIYQVENTDLDINESLKNRWIHEAKGVRALTYFNLVRAFGAVPLVTEPIGHIEAYEYLREDTDVIYQQIKSDLQDAINNLPENYSDGEEGRITRYGAAGILAKVHLTLEEYNAAQIELERIIESGLFSLDANEDGSIDEDDFMYLFEAGVKNSQASILEVQYKSGVDGNNSSHQNDFSPYLDAFDHPLIDESIRRGAGYNTPTDDLFDEFEEGDPRTDVTIMEGFTDASGNFIEYPFTLKYFDPNWHNAGQNIPIIRYADILLMYSEVTQDPAYLNMVRDRVGLPHYGTSEYPSALYPTLDLAIEHERRVELAMEFHRMFDLVRTGRVNEVMGNKVEGFNEVRLHFPIPLSVIDVNPAISQNPGY